MAESPSPRLRIRSSCRPPHSPSVEIAAFVDAALTPEEPIFVGASGGGDSTALLVLLADVARAQGRRLVAGVVDHALRQGSESDAAHAARSAEALGAEARVVRLVWPDGPKTAQAGARTARYAALARVARTVGARTLFLGHTLDDQAETLLMRADAGSGARGMAGMAALSPCPIWPEAHDFQLARPLLSWRRDALRDLLRAQHVDWIEDPANALPRYARVRARAVLAASGAAEALVSAVDTAGVAAAERAAHDFLTAHTAVSDDVATVRWISTDDACVRALCVLATAVGGATREPSLAAGARLAARLAAGQDGTLAGARFRAGDLVRVTRDPGGVLGRRGGGLRLRDVPLPVGETVIWDGRLALRADGPGWTAKAPESAPLQPILTHAGDGDGTVTQRWLVRDRLDRLLWRAGEGA